MGKGFDMSKKKFRSQKEIDEDIEKNILIRQRIYEKENRIKAERQKKFEKGCKMLEELPENSKKVIWEAVGAEKQELSIRKVDMDRISREVHAHDYFSFLYVVSGRCKLLLEGKTIGVGRNNFCVIAPGQRHQLIHYMKNAPYKLLWFAIDDIRARIHISKYTPRGGMVTVGMGVHDGQAVIRVADTGIGIAVDDRSRLFGKFFRVKRRDTMNIPGTGLGLAIVKSIVERHSGQVWVESELNRGSTFHISLPASRQAMVGVGEASLD